MKENEEKVYYSDDDEHAIHKLFAFYIFNKGEKEKKDMKEIEEKVYYSDDTNAESVDMFAYRMMDNMVSRVYICHDNEQKCIYLKIVTCTPDGDFKLACFPLLDGAVIDMSKPGNADDEYVETLVREIGEANQSMFDIMRIIADEKNVTKKKAMDILDRMIKEDDDDNSDN